MNNYAIGIIIAVITVMIISVGIGLHYSQATLLFGFIAAISAPLAVHRVPDKNWAIGLLLMLAVFGSFPLKNLYQIEGFLREIPLIAVYAGLLWVVGRGWRRRWT